MPSICVKSTLFTVETYPVFNQYFNGVLPKSVSQIMGVQFRNIATVGASVYAKYGFSDLITPLFSPGYGSRVVDTKDKLLVK